MSSLPIVISAAALAVAIYGIYERQRAAYTAIRMRITELLDDVGELNVEESRIADADAAEDASHSWFARSSIALRRSLLTYQAHALAERLRPVQRGIRGATLKLTASELGALAYALMTACDLREARRWWAESVDPDQHATPYVLAANHEGFADCLFALREYELARDHYRTAIDLFAEEVEDPHRAFGSCLRWLDQEQGIGDTQGRPGDATRRATAVIASLPDSDQPPAQMELRSMSRGLVDAEEPSPT